MCKLKNVAMVPNHFIKDNSIHKATRKVGLVLLLLSGRANMYVQVSYAALADIAGCSCSTAQRAIKELEDHGYIVKRREYRYSDSLGHLIYTANSYKWIYRSGSYTMVSRKILEDINTYSECGLLLTIYRCAGRSGRAFPSLRRLAGLLKSQRSEGRSMSKSTVCRALAELRRKQAIVRCRCRTHRGCYAANSYYVKDLVVSDPAKKSFKGGSTIIGKPIFINQISFSMRREKSCAPETEACAVPVLNVPTIPQMWFDGTAVRVSTDCELDITA